MYNCWWNYTDFNYSYAIRLSGDDMTTSKCIVEDRVVRLTDTKKGIDKRVKTRVITTEDFFINNLGHREILHRNVHPIATVLTKEGAEKNNIKIEDEDDNYDCEDDNYDCLVFIREKFKSIMTEDEVNALIFHELAHFVLGHGNITGEEEHKRQERKVEEAIGKENNVILELLNQRLIYTFPEEFFRY